MENNSKGLTMCTEKAGLTAGTTSTYTTANATGGFINGKFVTALAAQTNTATPTTDARTGAAFVALAASQGCVFVYGLNAAGAIQVIQSEVLSLDADTNDFKDAQAPQFPVIPDTVMPFGYVVVKNGSTGSAWTFGSSSWTATGVTDTYTDVGVLPPRPVTS